MQVSRTATAAGARASNTGASAPMLLKPSSSVSHSQQRQWRGGALLLPQQQASTRPGAAAGRRSLSLRAAAAVGAAALTSADGQGGGSKLLTLTYQEILARGPSRQLPLPPPPKAATFVHVLPYLLKLAVAEKALYWRVGLAFVCLLVSKVAGMMCPLMIKHAVDSFTVHAGEPLPAIIGAATQFVLLYGLCDIMKNVAKELQAPLFTPVSQEAARRVSYHTFAHVLDLDVKFHLERRTGRLSRILERGMRSIQMLYRAAIFTFAPTALELAFVCGVLAKTFSPLVGGLVLATFAAYVTWSILMTQVATDARKHVNELDNAVSAKAVDALLSYETVTLFNNQALEVGQYNAYLKQYMRACVTTDRLAAVLNAGQAIILAVGLTAIMVTALHTVGPSVNPGDLVMIQGLLLQLWAPLQFLGWFYRELRSALVDMEEFFGILRTRSNLVDGTLPLPADPPASITSAHASTSATSTNSHTAVANGAVTGPISTAAVKLSSSLNGHHGAAKAAESHNGNGNGNGVQRSNGSSNGAAHMSPQHLAQQQQHTGSGSSQQSAVGGLLVELDDVHFGYTPDRQILKGLSLRVEPGKSLALVGPSGSGKSTVLRLLTRLYDASSGSVRLNGQDIKDTQLQSLRDAVALVPQETMLFNDTIMQNIRYGRPSASDEEVVEAAKLAHLHEAVMRMPKGYGTVVGERGLKLSGGEKQRVAIARAFLRQPRLLICDEATSALDSATEAGIMAALAELAVGRTSVFVAHRLSTIKDCDTVAVLKEGKLVELGSHDELMARPGGLYRSMWEAQAARKAKQQEKQQQKQRDHAADLSRKHQSSSATMPHSVNGVANGHSATAAAALTTSGVVLAASAPVSMEDRDDSSTALPILDPLQEPVPEEALAAGLLDDSHHVDHVPGERGQEEEGFDVGQRAEQQDEGDGPLSSLTSVDMDDDLSLLEAGSGSINGQQSGGSSQELTVLSGGGSGSKQGRT